MMVPLTHLSEDRGLRSARVARKVPFIAAPLLILIPIFGPFLLSGLAAYYFLSVLLVTPIFFSGYLLYQIHTQENLAKPKRPLHVTTVLPSLVYLILAILDIVCIIPLRVDALSAAQSAQEGAKSAIRLQDLMEIIRESRNTRNMKFPESLGALVTTDSKCLPLIISDSSECQSIIASMTDGSKNETGEAINDASDLIYRGKGVLWNWNEPQVIIFMSKSDFGKQYRVFGWNNGQVDWSDLSELQVHLSKDASQRQKLGLEEVVWDKLNE